jgi:hypothetical protein
VTDFDRWEATLENDYGLSRARTEKMALTSFRLAAKWVGGPWTHSLPWSNDLADAYPQIRYKREPSSCRILGKLPLMPVIACAELEMLQALDWRVRIYARRSRRAAC